MLLKLGSFDKGAIPEATKEANAKKLEILEPYHSKMQGTLKEKLKFRDEVGWIDFQPVVPDETGRSVKKLQEFLKSAGFMPFGNLDGIFGYRTQAAARLFQEYIRTMVDESIGTPDGLIGNNTWKFIDNWKTGDVCEWGKASASKPSPEYKRWLKLLSAAKAHFKKIRNEHPILQLVEQYQGDCDTKKVADWDVSSKTTHLIGIRRNQDQKIAPGTFRGNDDLFVLLINGLVFKFWGSTDPSAQYAGDKKDALPFLIESQHEYKFSWHFWADENKIYQALRPAGKGVLVIRDKDKDRTLTETDSKALDPTSPNTTINIHWSGIGNTNFSAGCQVFAGNAYINHNGATIDCSNFAASGQKSLGTFRTTNGIKYRQTRGAYNMFADLLLSYTPPPKDKESAQTIRYLLGRDETFKRFEGWSDDFVDIEVRGLGKRGNIV